MKGLRYILILVLAGTLSCSKERAPDYTPVASEVLRIGALLPLTGQGSSSGIPMEVALNLAQQDISAYFTTAGITLKTELVVVDTRTDTAEALNQMRNLWYQGIRMVIGPYSSAELAHIRNFADTHGMLIVSPSSEAVSIAIPGDNVFRFITSDAVQGKAMSKLLMEDKIRVIIPLVRNDLWGNDLLGATRSEFIRLGGMVQPPILYDPSSTGFSQALTLLDSAVAGELQHHNPNDVAVYLLTFSEGCSILAHSGSYTHLNSVYWYGGSAFSQNASIPEDTAAARFAYTHGLPCPMFGQDESARDLWLPLNDRIIQQTGYTPDVYAFTAYDALQVLVRARLTAGKNASVEQLKNVFVAEAGSYFGVTGNTGLDANGDRAYGNYDFWAVKSDSVEYHWKKVARYNSRSGILTRLNE